MKLKYIILYSLLGITLFVGCENQEEPSADRTATLETERALQEARRQVPQASITNWQELRLTNWIYELRDQENLICHAYYFNILEGKRGDYIGKCIGYGIPYSVQVTNPEKFVEGDKELGYDYTGLHIYQTPQPEPNGLFMPEGLSATWLIILHPETNEPMPVYIEPQIVVYPFPVHEYEE